MLPATKKITLLLALTALISTTSCDEDSDDNQLSLEVPETYTFTRDGESTVSFSGQTERLDMVSEMKTYMKKGDAGEAIDADVLLNMFANENSPFSAEALNTSTKQIENKTFATDVQFFKDLFVAAEAVSIDVSDNSTSAEEGVAGTIERGTGGTFINVSEKGWEFTQIMEKGLMGALMYNQIFNSYLTDEKIGESVDNETIVEGKNYTTLEHHWDEAFGYWGVPVDFPNGDPVLTDAYNRFWANYTNGLDDILGLNEPLMTAYITGRAAIVAKDHETKNEQVTTIYELHELVAAAKAVGYINEALNDLNVNDTGNLFHHLSEGYGFVKAIKYSPYAALTTTQIETILTENFGTDGDFWKVSAQGLTTAKSTITSAYPKLAGVADSL
ncbi:MAG: DUF4856 domain-containing protein [Cyclobacteriaceae bacterium]